MPADKLVSVIVSTYNRPDALQQVLRGCAAQTDKNFEVVVADDGSGEATRATVAEAAEAAARSALTIEHVWHPDEGFRLAAIRNKGIARSRGSYLIFLDGDCVPQRQFVAHHRALAEAGTMVTGSRILLGAALTSDALGRGLPLQDQAAGFWFKQRLAGQVNKILPIFVNLPDAAIRRVHGFKWRGIKGCNLAAWRTDVERVNGFDESFTGWGHEDADFVVRLFNAGVGPKRGFCATEVFQLWHAEQARDRAGPNRDRVLARLAERTIRATHGLDDGLQQ
jgi:glycosyltransferase involved in cell wall biosynthesis